MTVLCDKAQTDRVKATTFCGDIFCFPLAGRSSARARKKFSFSFQLACHTDSLTAVPLGTLCAYLMSRCFCWTRSLMHFWVPSCFRTQDCGKGSWLARHDSKGLSRSTRIAPWNLSAASAFCSLTWLACAQVLAGVSQVQLSGYLFVYTIITIIISFPDQLIAFLAPLSTSSSITFCFSLLFLGVKIPWDGVEQGVTEQETNCFWRVPFTFYLFIYFIFCFVSDAEVSLARNKMNPRDSK